MELDIQPFSELIETVSNRIELTKIAGVNAPIRRFSDAYGTDLIIDPEKLQLLASTIENEAVGISRIANGRNLDTKPVEKFNPFNLRKISGWIVGSEVLFNPDYGTREEFAAYGTFLSTGGMLFNLQEKTMGKNNIPDESVKLNSKLYGERDLIKIFKYSGLKEIKLEKVNESYGKGLITVREHLAEFVIKNSLQGSLDLR